MANIYKFRQWSLTLLRAVLGFVFMYHGYLKLFSTGGLGGTIKFFTAIAIPLPAFSAVVVSIAEFAGGLFLILGFLAKWTSLVLMIDMAVAIYKVHFNKGFLAANSGYEFVALLFFSLLVILFNGPGSLALERVIFKTLEESDEEEKSEEKILKEKTVKVKDIDGSGIIAKTGIEKEPGFLYFLDKKGDVARVQMARRGEKTSKKHEVIAKVGVQRKEGYLYFIDKNGNVSRAEMARGQ